jgi:hypothetical protein
MSNDNPFSEAQFKTLKNRPAFPARFGSHPTPWCARTQHRIPAIRLAHEDTIA